MVETKGVMNEISVVIIIETGGPVNETVTVACSALPAWMMVTYSTNFSVPEEVIGWNTFGPAPQHLICPICKNKVITETHSTCSWKTHLASTIMCCLCCPFCLVPYYVDAFKTVKHFCPACGMLLGEYRG